jgi:hypothetical protein
LYAKCREKRLFAEPVGPEIRLTLLSGYPPSIRSSNPSMPVGTLFRCFLPRIQQSVEMSIYFPYINILFEKVEV